ncbi:hypothetical protein, partial [Salmonella sp. SAL04284]|uniref:hypothetical protein n=1 Tax=Salmonella sp. SAL04284 TaxID=3159862 RepID=UPI00397CCB17
LGEAALAGDFEEAGEVAELDAVVEVHGVAVAASGAGMVPNGQVGDEVACDEIAPRRCSASLSLKGEGTGWSIIERNDSPILRRAVP